MGRYHHAVVKVEWYDSSANMTRTLLTEAAYLRPVEQTYSCVVRDESGNIVPNHEVRVLDGKGDYVTTVMSDANGSGLAATMTTNAEGVAKSPALRKGKYLVKEHADPTGYVTDLATLDCVVRSDETTAISATNQPIQGKIRIVKTDELTKEALAGAEFTITRVSGLPSHKGSNDGEVVAVITTDSDGIAVSPLLTWGTYQVEETGIPLHLGWAIYWSSPLFFGQNTFPLPNFPPKGLDFLFAGFRTEKGRAKQDFPDTHTGQDV